MSLAAILTAITEVTLGITIVGFGQHRAAYADRSQTGLLGRFFNRDVGAFISDGRKEIIAVRQVGMVLLRAADSDKLFHLVVIRRDVAIANRPVFAASVAAIAAEIVLIESVRKSPPEHRTPAHITGAEP